jgi:hypothetical protein
MSPVYTHERVRHFVQRHPLSDGPGADRKGGEGVHRLDREADYAARGGQRPQAAPRHKRDYLMLGPRLRHSIRGSRSVRTRLW